MATATELRSEPVPAPDAAIAVTGLVKRYDKVTAVAGIDLAVARGEIFGFLGPNDRDPVHPGEGHRGFRHRGGRRRRAPP